MTALRFASFKVAAPVFVISADPLRMQFRRGELPTRFLLRLSRWRVIVDAEGLIEFLWARPVGVQVGMPETGL